MVKSLRTKYLTTTERVWFRISSIVVYRKIGTLVIHVFRLRMGVRPTSGSKHFRLVLALYGPNCAENEPLIVDEKEGKYKRDCGVPCQHHP